MNADLKLLILEDEDEWATTISRVVNSLGWSHKRVTNVDEALRSALKKNFDIAVVDRLLDNSEDGLSLISAFQKYEITTLILVISQLSTTGETVVGLEAGADDYLAKPFDETELRARLVALARRLGKWSLYPTVELVGDLEIRQSARTVTWDGASMRLPDQLFDLLWVFASHRGEVLSREMLWREVWVDFSGLEPQNNTIEAAVGRLRKELEKLTGKTFIRSVRGRGYRFAVD